MVPKVAELLEAVGFHRWSMTFCPRNVYNIYILSILFDLIIIIYLINFFCIGKMLWLQRLLNLWMQYLKLKENFLYRYFISRNKYEIWKIFHERQRELVNSENKLVSSMCKNINPSIKQTCLLHMLTQENLEEGEQKWGVESKNHFQQEKITVQYVKYWPQENCLPGSKCPLNIVTVK